MVLGGCKEEKVGGGRTAYCITTLIHSHFTHEVVIRVGCEVRIRYSGGSAGIRYALENDWKSMAKLPVKVRFHCRLDD